MNSFKYETCVVRFKDNDGALVGSGILVSERIIITCAHVVMEACSHCSYPQNACTVVFPFCGNEAISAEVIAMGSTDKDAPAKDIAVLQVHSSIPPGAKPRAFTSVNEKWHDLSFRTWGATKTNPNGDWITGFLSGLLPDKTVQLWTSREIPMCIEPGFSGSPIWNADTCEVLGILVQNDNRKLISYMIPAVEILNFWKDLPVVSSRKIPLFNREKSYLPVIKRNIPFFGDRLPQRDGIHLLMNNTGQKTVNKPYICILMGNLSDFPRKFINKFRCEILYDDPVFKNNPSIFKPEVIVSWPTAAYSVDERWKILMKALSNALDVLWKGDENHIRTILTDSTDNFRIIYFEIPSEKKRLCSSDRELIIRLLTFFNSLNNLKDDQYIFIFFSFVFTDHEKKGLLSRLLKRDENLNAINNFWQKHNKENYSGFHCKSLGSLQMIRVEHLEEYITRYGKHYFNDERILRNGIKDIYKKSGSTEITMETLSNGISQLLTEIT